MKNFLYVSSLSSSLSQQVCGERCACKDSDLSFKFLLSHNFAFWPAQVFGKASFVKQPYATKLQSSIQKQQHYVTRNVYQHSFEVHVCLVSVMFCLQTLPGDFDVKAKVTEVLDENGYELKRARMMDIDDFLG